MSNAIKQNNKRVNPISLALGYERFGMRLRRVEDDQIEDGMEDGGTSLYQ